jgi:ATP-binding cassette subfamily F protein 3
MLALRDVACGYGSAAVVREVTRTVLAGQRIGILGANGQGKSTLVKTLAGALPVLAGTATPGKGLAIGYFAQQELDLLHADDTALQMMVRLARERPAPGADTREQALRNHLGQFRFEGDMVHQGVGTLSGGERARLVLAMLVWQRPNLLLLDEPTNHLDLATREALSVALNGFEGTVLLVSHDRALLREVCDEFWLVAGGRVQPFDGDLDDYQKWLLDVSRAAARGQPAPEPPKAAVAEPPQVAAKAVAKAPPPPAAPKPVPKPETRESRQQAKQARVKQSERLRPLRAELTRIDERLAKLGTEKSEVEAAMAAPGGDYAELGRRLAHVAAEVAMLEERWLELHTELEALQAAD